MERIDLSYGIYWQETNARNAVGKVYNSDGQEIVTSMLRMDAQAISDAMKPTYTKPHPIECDDVVDESGLVVAKGGNTNGR